MICVCVYPHLTRHNNIIVVVLSCKLTTDGGCTTFGSFCVLFLRYATLRHCGIGGRRDNFSLFLNFSYKKTTVFYRLAFDCGFLFVFSLNGWQFSPQQLNVVAQSQVFSRGPLRLYSSTVDAQSKKQNTYSYITLTRNSLVLIFLLKTINKL